MMKRLANGITVADCNWATFTENSSFGPSGCYTEGLIRIEANWNVDPCFRIVRDHGLGHRGILGPLGHILDEWVPDGRGKGGGQWETRAECDSLWEAKAVAEILTRGGSIVRT